MADRDLAPAAFLGHGNPMNALSDNAHTRAWRRFGHACGRPRAVLAVSAHWYTNATAVTAMPHPRTIHDFYGFPRELHEFAYPAPGSPDLAREVAESCGPDLVALDGESWGLDHGTWSVLAHCFPEADVPVVQLSINALQPAEYHLELGRRLAPLRARGVVIIGSGNLVHDLGHIRWDLPEGAFEWAERFDDAARSVLTVDPARAATLLTHPDYSSAAPTPDHFLPLLYIAGLAEVTGRPATVLTEGIVYGSVSMTAFALDLPDGEHPRPSVESRAPGTPTDPTPAPPPDMPADQSNM